MAVNLQGIRRNIKNVAHNYTDAQVKVREATSNDPWGPSSTMMSEIADLTYNVAAFSEIMQMVWKRLNDHGKNWRHVYKALVLLEYLIKTGSEKVAQQCKENIYAIQTLKDFQHLEENKDQGINVREKAKAVVALLKDDDRLKNERVRALKAKERFAQAAAGIGSDTVYNGGVRVGGDRFDGGGLNPGGRPGRGASPSGGFGPGGSIPLAGQHLSSSGGETDGHVPTASEIEAARPQTVGEEELQLQLALAMSREEAGQEETKNKSDDVRLQLALQKSKETKEDDPSLRGPDPSQPQAKPSNDLLDLADINFGNPVTAAPVVPALSGLGGLGPAPPQRTSASTADPWGVQQPNPPAHQPANNDPWGAAPTQQAPNPPVVQQQNDPWAAIQAPPPSSAVGRTASPQPPPPSGANTTIPAYNDPWNPSATAAPKSPALNLRSTHSPAGGAGPADNDPWQASGSGGAPPSSAEGSTQQSIDPFSPVAQNQLAEFDMLRDQMEKPSMQPSSNPPNNGGSTSPNPFDLGGLGTTLMPTTNGSNNSNNVNAATGTKPKKGVQSILGEHSNLVNLDELVSSTGKQQVRNPFEQQPPNPFAAAKAPKPAMNDLLQQQSRQGAPGLWGGQQPQQQQQPQQPQQDFFDAWK